MPVVFGPCSEPYMCEPICVPITLEHLNEFWITHNVDIMCTFNGTGPECRWGCGSSVLDVDEMGAIQVFVVFNADTGTQQTADDQPIDEYAKYYY